MALTLPAFLSFALPVLVSLRVSLTVSAPFAFLLTGPNMGSVTRTFLLLDLAFLPGLVVAVTGAPSVAPTTPGPGTTTSSVTFVPDFEDFSFLRIEKRLLGFGLRLPGPAIGVLVPQSIRMWRSRTGGGMSTD